MTNMEIITAIAWLLVEVTKRQKSYKKDEKTLMKLCKQLEDNGVVDSAESLFKELTR